MEIYHQIIASPVGALHLYASTQHLLGILWGNEQPKWLLQAKKIHVQPNVILQKTQNQLTEYFDRKRHTFDLPLLLQGTVFQKTVWDSLQNIPFGETYSYLQIAQFIDHPKAVRAVGAAIGKNPISIIVPCHRVIGTNGKLTGFAGGLENKKILLDIEQQVVF
ncbi:methylated-DNA--[protein]-cysteine S-methyltransferase [Acinetobacter qingfengensis]|uniref:Methylated-DNA--protein-cysteine methyltransferase n=1 Tax=Acinetobacter qingfengensis TaxID=1262585 RepID=A0A1E7QXK6_9GAMM|nr:methylated-DNA--[protein]-cysteine S-methyltransferase [Acinetobacter qingfengensis]KAA8731703.1 methylated-DNA--[protein]-cysteine S-methyltransferase [Acinetobacter qingfengensis]OEY91802.1 glycosyltransferase [Acinetobacter qingfengensis]